MAKTILYLQENGFVDYDEFFKKVDEMTAKVNELREEIKTSETRIKELTELREQVINYLICVGTVRRVIDIFSQIDSFSYSN